MDASRVVRPLTADDQDRWIAILANAYPMMDLHSREARAARAQTARERPPTPGMRTYGLFEDGELAGGMRLYDFHMTCFETPMLVGGVGMVAVDLTRKKAHVARDLIAFYLRHYRERGAPLGILYPFRPDFYGAMGFGYGPKLNTYRIAPTALPNRGDRTRARFLTDGDRESAIDLYNAVASRTHGMIPMSPDYARGYLASPEWRQIGWYGDGGDLRGVVAFSFDYPDKQANFILHDIVIHQLVYADSEALLGLMAFLRAQADQARAIILHTLNPDFHHLLTDPRNGALPMPSVYHQSNTQGVGLMYRLLDVRRFFEALPDHRFGAESLTLRLTLRDSFLPEQDGAVVVRFERGAARVVSSDARASVALALNVGDASALLMGCVSLRGLYDLGLAEVSDPSAVSRLNALFSVERPPMCDTGF